MEQKTKDKLSEFIEDAKNKNALDRILTLMENHPILSAIIVYIFVSKIGKIVNEKYKYKEV